MNYMGIDKATYVRWKPRHEHLLDLFIEGRATREEVDEAYMEYYSHLYRWPEPWYKKFVKNLWRRLTRRKL